MSSPGVFLSPFQRCSQWPWSICTHISVTAGRNFFIWGKVAYDVEIMPNCWYCLVSQMHRQKFCLWKMFPCYKDTQQQIHLVLLSSMFAHYIGLYAHTGQMGWFKKCVILVPVYMHCDYRWYKIMFIWKE